ncbi:MAG: nitrous oxide-stimulated promoter family protein [Smithellaceae bacterium]
MPNNASMQREYETITTMIYLYCHDLHQTNGSELCFSCDELLTYAKSRLEKCPYSKDKPTCDTCPVHCYKPRRRKQIQEVMRYAGPRMIRSHPLMAFRHLLKKLKKAKA